MKRLWAPWRMQYIRNAGQPGCFLCDIFRSDQDREHLVVQRGETGAVVMNRYPYNNGHLLVAPYRHVDSLETLSDKELLEMMRLTTLTCRHLKQVLHPDGFNLGLNLGTAAGAGLKDHLHLHIVPRWTGDTNFMPVLADVKVVPQPLDELWQQLRRALESVSAPPQSES